MKSQLTALLFLAVFGTTAHASLFDVNGNKLPDSDVNSPAVSWTNPSIHADTSVPVGLLQNPYSVSCTATFIDTHGNDQTPAYLLSAGHCVPGMLNGSEILNPVPSLRLEGLTFSLNVQFDAKEWQRDFAVEEISYATMNGVDLMVAKLSISYGKLVARGFKPAAIATAIPAVGTALVNLGIPSPGDETEATRVLKRSVCFVSETGIGLHEGNWHWEGTWKGLCNSIGGLSGSPMFNKATNEIVGVLNTGVGDDALKSPECSEDRPCEVASDGAVLRTDSLSAYSQRVDVVAGCFENGIFDVNLGSCGLPKPAK
jgi:hypothetical protein